MSENGKDASNSGAMAAVRQLWSIGRKSYRDSLTRSESEAVNSVDPFVRTSSLDVVRGEARGRASQDEGEWRGAGAFGRGDEAGESYRGDVRGESGQAVKGRRDREVFRDGTMRDGSRGGEDDGVLTVTEARRLSADAAWTVVVPEQTRGETPSSDDILEALRPLTTMRKMIKPLRYVPGAAVREADQVELWAEENEDVIENTTYFLIAGDPADVPFALTHHLGLGKVVGRLALETKEQYAAYAEKVVAAEAARRETPVRPLLFFAPDWDTVLGRCKVEVIDPLVAEILKKGWGHRLGTLLDSDATWRRFGRELAKGEPGGRNVALEGGASLIFVATHGGELGRRSEYGALADEEYTMLDSAWVKDFGGPIAQDGVMVIFGCNGAGIGKDRSWISRVSYEAIEPGTDRPTPLTKALLASSRGPLAIVAHEDLIFTEGMDSLLVARDQNADDGNHSTVRPFIRLMTGLEEGVPVGIAMQRLRRAFYLRVSRLELLRAELEERKLQLKEEICGLDDKARQERRSKFDNENDQLGGEILRAWLRWHFMRNWVVLGDPRATLEGCNGRVSLEDAYRGDENYRDERRETPRYR